MNVTLTVWWSALKWVFNRSEFGYSINENLILVFLYSIPSSLHYLIIQTTLYDEYYHNSHFTDKRIDRRKRLSNCPGAQSSREWLGWETTQVTWFQKLSACLFLWLIYNLQPSCLFTVFLHRMWVPWGSLVCLWCPPKLSYAWLCSMIRNIYGMNSFRKTDLVPK